MICNTPVVGYVVCCHANKIFMSMLVLWQFFEPYSKLFLECGFKIFGC